jgi:hypothetical protein
MEDGAEKLAAFFRENGLMAKDRARTQNASTPSRRGRTPWKLVPALVFLTFVVWSLLR